MIKWCLLITLPLAALQTQPWFGPLFQPELRGDAFYLYSPKADTAFGVRNITEQRETLYGSLMITPWFNWSAEVELAVSHTHQRHTTFFDFGRLTARYLLLNEFEGSPASMTLGTSLTLPSDTSVRCPATYQLDLPTLSFHSAIGKEIFYYTTWKWRLWAFGACHIPFNGPPHLQGILYAERNLWDCQFVRFLVDGHMGLGDRPFNPHQFNGYGPIQTRRILLGLRYAIRAFWDGDIHVQYQYTVYAKNTGLETHRLFVGFFYPI
ncbi:MAG: hypothetical protein AB7F31_04715 [Parachlamydiales bacterium]